MIGLAMFNTRQRPKRKYFNIFLDLWNSSYNTQRNMKAHFVTSPPPWTVQIIPDPLGSTLIQAADGSYVASLGSSPWDEANARLIVKVVNSYGKKTRK